MRRVQFSLLLFFAPLAEREEKKLCRKSGPRNCGSGQYRMERMETYANSVTTQPKQQHGWIWCGNTTAVAGVVDWPRVGASGNTTTTNHGRIGVGDSSLYLARYSLRGYV